MNIINWSGYEWLTSERWGEIHPEKASSWYDPSAIEIRNGDLVLKTHRNPKKFIIDGKEIVSNIGIGLVSNTTKFKHGYFEIEAKLPKGKNLWPAFWMWSFDSWPPEIDIFEGYSNRFASYFKIQFGTLLGFWNVQTNVHYIGDDNKNKSIKAKTHWMGFKNPQNNFIKYGCLWEENKITIFYNKRKVRTITDKKFIEQFNGIDMNLIINNAIRNEDVDYSEFIIRYFKYIPIKNYK